jgi:uncharacterized metal-binding protein YceD (DUF177 family)
MSEFEYDYWRNDKPKCPHCKIDFEVWSEDHPMSLNYEDGGKTTFECERCNKEFVCVTSISYTFSTAISDEAADNEDWGPERAELT